MTKRDQKILEKEILETTIELFGGRERISITAEDLAIFAFSIIMTTAEEYGWRQ